VEWDGSPVPATGDHQSPHSAARAAAGYMKNMREIEVAESLKTRDGFVAALKEHPDTTWNAVIANKSEDELAAELVKAKAAPNSVNPIRDAAVLEPLLDHVKPMNLEDKDLFENPRDAARAMREFRETVERAQNAIVESIDQQIIDQQ